MKQMIEFLLNVLETRARYLFMFFTKAVASTTAFLLFTL